MGSGSINVPVSCVPDVLGLGLGPWEYCQFLHILPKPQGPARPGLCLLPHKLCGFREAEQAGVLGQLPLLSLCLDYPGLPRSLGSWLMHTDGPSRSTPASLQAWACVHGSGALFPPFASRNLRAWAQGPQAALLTAVQNLSSSVLPPRSP